MDNVIRLLVEAAESLDDKGLRAIADRVDKIANKAFDIKTAQYVGIQGYAIRNSRCWGNCYRQKRTTFPNKSAQQVWTECHKEYVESINNDGSKWDKYAGSESNIKIGSELHVFSQQINTKIANKVEEKVAEGLDVGSAVFASIEEVVNEPNDLIISASNEIMDIASKLVSNPEISEKLTAAAEEMIKEAGMFDLFRGIGQGVKNWGSNAAYTGKLSTSIKQLNANFENFKNAHQQANEAWAELDNGVKVLSQELSVVSGDPNSTPQQKQQASTAMQYIRNAADLMKQGKGSALIQSWPTVLASLNSILRGNYGANPSTNPSAGATPPAGATAPTGINPAKSTNPLPGTTGPAARPFPTTPGPAARQFLKSPKPPLKGPPKPLRGKPKP